jgi:Fe-S-cluster-containing dehydrogenase component
MNENEVSRRNFLRMLAAGSGLILFTFPPTRGAGRDGADYDESAHYWGYAVDTTRCIGCLACMRACRAENDVPEGSVRTWIERYRVTPDGETHVDACRDESAGFMEVDGEGEVSKAFFVPKICNHCEKSVCSQVCPVGASYHAKDGVVLVDEKRCIGCGYCVQACPYGTRFINPKTHVADKCTLCYHRITKGMEPACVAACPKDARIFGDLKDPASRLSTILRQRRFSVLKPEMGTHPKCYYIGLDQEVV